MGITIKCKKCGCTDGYLRVGDIHTGLHCSNCNSWIKWVSKNEVSILESGETIVDEFFEEVVDIEALEKERAELTRKIDEYYRRKIEKEVFENSKYIGKMFKKQLSDECVKFCKIIDIEKDNRYRMSTLVFTLPPDNPNKISIDSFMGKGLLNIESIGWFCDTINNQQFVREIDLYTEISNEEYEQAFNSWLEKIKRI